ncbi:MAG TPA: hypothetical protein VLL27_12500 [Solirubrobacterales bacterium]|nr:hypothetical protein [Solirubrobacterales bacterium]
MAPWKLPLLVGAIAVPTIAAFYVGGPGVGVAVGALVAVAIVAAAVRARPDEAIGEPAVAGSDRRLLVVTACEVEDQEVIGRIAAEAAASEGQAPAEVLVLAPARIGFLDRWASDLEPARRAAQQNLVITVASLAKAGVAAEARVGDEDLVQAVEDVVSTYRATEVILVTAAAEREAAAELEGRLRVPLLRLSLSDPAAR